jgi:predicted glycoside hydrolase/deacetylase ChbG (UPF0249 family)
MKKGIFVVADDFGLHESVNDGIVFALKSALIEGVSFMPTGEAVAHAIEKLRYIKDPNVGIHFVLVDEKLLALKNFYKNHKIFFIKYILGLIPPKDIEKEFRAQLERCTKEGIKISFINSHQHLHLLPGIMDIVIKLAKENNIAYIRTVTEPFSLKGGLFRYLESIFLSMFSRLARNKIKKNDLETNDIFVGFLHAGNLSKEDIDFAKDFYKKHPDAVIELGCHPGFETDELRAKYKNWGYNWQKELKTLDILKER